MRKRPKPDGSEMAGPRTSRASTSLLALPNTSRKPPSRRRVPARAPLHLEIADKLGGLPNDLGVALLGLGLLGVVIPGPIPLGASFILMGTAFLWPGLVARFGGCLASRLPGLFRLLIDFVDHLRSDLKRRHPGSLRA
jgi:hypothetical protein